MLLWFILSLIISLAAVAISVPFIRRHERARLAGMNTMSVYRDQMEEVERDLEQGVLDKKSAKIARSEIEQRILEKVASPEGDRTSTQFSPEVRSGALVGAVAIVVLGSVTLYGVTGRPDLEAKPFAGILKLGVTENGNNQKVLQLPATTGSNSQTNVSSGVGSKTAGDVKDMIGSLAARLEKNPLDAAGWRMLAWSYFSTKEYKKSAEAYGKAVALAGKDPLVQSAYGEALVRAADGLVTTKALAVFDTVLTLDKNDARARFFKGLALEQDGDPGAAINLWIDILKTAPNDADWIANLRQRVQELAAASSIDLTGRLNVSSEVASRKIVKKSEPVPTSKDVQAVLALPPKDQQAMILSMVERLAARLEENPRDAKGWIRLMRSRLVLGETDAAQNARRRAEQVFSDEPQTLIQITSAAKKMGLPNN